MKTIKKILDRSIHLKSTLVTQIRRLKSDGPNHRMDALKELFRRYKGVFQFWWERREQIKMPELKAHEAEFLPAALSIQTAPVSPMGRWVARILLILLLVLFLWSVIGKMDIVVNGQGKIIPAGYTKTIASTEVAMVTGLHVLEGQAVKAGDLLIELDSRTSDSEQSKADGDRQLALLQMERSKALLHSLDNTANLAHASNKPVLRAIDGVNEAYYLREVRHLQDQWSDYIAKYSRIHSQIRRYSAALEIAVRRSIDFAELAKNRDVSHHAYLEKEQARIDLLGQLDDAKTQLTALTAEVRKGAQDDLYQATRIWSGATQDAFRAKAQSERLRITSPVDGVVQQLNAHTIGGVVPAAQPLMLIVPSQHTIEMEAYVDNKDIGFIREGQVAHVKVDAYEYAKYGTLPAVVSHISRDAVDFSGSGTGQFASKNAEPGQAGSGKGLMYAVKVTLKKPALYINGKLMPLSPGMSGSVEIKTGERRIIQYFLSPLVVHSRESLNER
jgi:hemolysin D